MAARPKLVTAAAVRQEPREFERQQEARLPPEERMYIEIYDAIMEHRLPAGTKLTEQTLGEIYDLARHNVRKVLGKLAADGLVDLEPNRGAYIASPSEQEAHDMFELRQTLEQMVMQKVARQATAADFDKLRGMIERERDAYMQGNRPLWIRLSADFHIELAKLTGNMLLVDMLRRLVSRTTLLISNAETTGQQPCSFDEHLLVVDALQKKDEKGAQHEMAHHLEQCACRMLKRPEKRFDLRAALGKGDA
ncbi:GntR family transcriptional regulator [Noviherbaspirillum sp. CPCC 100848]|uniref:GntR family transcriptional regulator n=1 Tax=Noviherbaspirillum album TaxID=3080276 RepID=A0ABU6J2W9_9BURK|nr:GntR family transcriptional regulator [Noviherbaspirillum sp. CPCC 100848]MEC4717967.1 GntR family transcriptional regulator [Noviherbaspirillum sp. CPCC 100848]